ncbi:hypothetical protein [Rhodococcoides fascians]|uniref:hypothetical protein n=1 Tax=Rhodococcoides fascians TaxID=1828 RepID=UPI00050C3A6E|nr:hypothetical protein [Rhodococcus fascians]
MSITSSVEVAAPATTSLRAPAPAVPTVAAEAPSPPTIKAAAPSIPTLTVPGSWVPPMAYTALAEFFAAATFSAAQAVRASMVASFTAGGVLAVTVTTKATVVAGFDAAGSLSAFVGADGGIKTVDAPFGGAGTLSADLSAIAPAAGDFTAAGVASAAVSVPVLAAMTAAGDLTVLVEPHGFVDVSFEADGTFGSTVAVPVPADASAAADLSVAIRAIAPMVAAFTGSGTAQAAAASSLSAAMSAAADLSVDVTAKASVTADFSAAAELSAPSQSDGGTYEVAADFTADPILEHSSFVRFALAAAAEASATLSAVAVGQIAVNAFSTGSADLTVAGPLVAHAAPFTANVVLSVDAKPSETSSMGMDKVTSQTTNDTFIPLTGWAIRDGYPGTDLVSDALVMSGDGIVNIIGQLTVADTSRRSPAFRILVNGNVVYESPGVAGVVATGSVNVALTHGDVVTMTARSSNVAYFNVAILPGPTNTFLYFEPMPVVTADVPSFTGDAVLLADSMIAPKVAVDAGFTGDGSASAAVIVGFGREAAFTASGTAAAAIQLAATADFSAAGGASATAFASAQIEAAFTADGALSTTVIEREVVAAEMTGAGDLTVEIMQRMAVPASFTAVGFPGADISSPQLRKDFFDGFNGSATTQDLTQFNSNWVSSPSTVAPYVVQVLPTGVARLYIGSQDLTAYGSAYWTTSTSTDDQYVSAVIADPASAAGMPFSLLARIGQDGSAGITMQMYANSVRLAVNGVVISSRDDVVGTPVAGTVYELRVIGNAIQGYRNGVAMFAAFEMPEGGRAPIGEANRRVGFMLASQRAFYGNYYSPTLDWWAGGDFPIPVRSVVAEATVSADLSAEIVEPTAAPKGQRMVKSGSYTLPAALSYRDVLGWVADPLYPATVIVSDGLAVKAGLKVTVSAALLRNGTNTGNRARIVDTAGNQIAQATSASPITIAPFSYTPTVDTVLRVQGYAQSGIGGNTTIPDDPASHLTVEP